METFFFWGGFSSIAHKIREAFQFFKLIRSRNDFSSAFVRNITLKIIDIFVRIETENAENSDRKLFLVEKAQKLQLEDASNLSFCSYRSWNRQNSQEMFCFSWNLR